MCEWPKTTTPVMQLVFLCMALQVTVCPLWLTGCGGGGGEEIDHVNVYTSVPFLWRAYTLPRLR